MNKAVTVTDSSFEQDVLKASGPVLVDYWADWCGPCKSLGPLVDAAADRFGEQLTVAKIDVDANSETPAKYGIRGIPTLMIFRDGEAVDTSVGALSESQLNDFLQSHI